MSIRLVALGGVALLLMACGEVEQTNSESPTIALKDVRVLVTGAAISGANGLDFSPEDTSTWHR